MKNLLKLKGAKSLTKQEQKAIDGGGGFSCYQQSNYFCCQTLPSGVTFCDAGRCRIYTGQCFWY